VPPRIPAVSCIPNLKLNRRLAGRKRPAGAGHFSKEKGKMNSKLSELPIGVEVPEGTIRFTEWGEMTVETGTFSAQVDPAPFFKGLPHDRCQCPHWGYVIKGQLRYRTADGDLVFNAGEAYYCPPGHTPVFEAGVEYVEFSPTVDLSETTAVVERNMAAMVGSA
jgi:hypothetical protein